jgi:membrane protein
LAAPVDLSKRDTHPPAKPGLVQRVKAVVARVEDREAVQHWMRAYERFRERLGSQFAGAITYFSVLSLVPILMVAFSVAGFVLANQPELLNGLEEAIARELPAGSGDIAASINTVIQEGISARYTVGLFGLAIALYSGIGWMGNVRNAVQAQWRPDFDEDQEVRSDGFVKNLFRNLGSLAGLGLAIAVSIALSAAGTSASSAVLQWLGLEDIAALKPVFTAVPVLIAMAADVLIFMWVYTILPPRKQKGTRKALVRGSVMAAVAFEIFKFALTFLLPKVTSTATGQVFGSIIGLFFFFNITATMVLLVAAWISTSPGGPQKRRVDPADSPETPEPVVLVRDRVSAPKAVGLLSVGAILGLGWSRRHR